MAPHPTPTDLYMWARVEDAGRSQPQREVQNGWARAGWSVGAGQLCSHHSPASPQFLSCQDTGQPRRPKLCEAATGHGERGRGTGAPVSLPQIPSFARDSKFRVGVNSGRNLLDPQQGTEVWVFEKAAHTDTNRHTRRHPDTEILRHRDTYIYTDTHRPVCSQPSATHPQNLRDQAGTCGQSYQDRPGVLGDLVWTHGEDTWGPVIPGGHTQGGRPS